MGNTVTNHRDVWIDITSLGDPVPRSILAVDGHELEIEEAKTLYVHGRIDTDELERRIGETLRAKEGRRTRP